MENLLTWGNLSALIIGISGISYMWGIYTKTIERPVLSTWGIWSLIGLLLLLTYYDAGARMDTTLPAAWMSFISPLIIFLLALWYGKGGWTRLDSWCLGLCLCTVLVWQTTNSALLGILGALIADSMGAIPQIRKNWTDARDEPWLPWVLFAIGSAINFLEIESWNIEFYIYPLYMSTAGALIVIPILTERIRRKYYGFS